MTVISRLRKLLDLAESVPSTEIDEHDRFRFEQQFGPALGRIGNFVIYSQSDAERLVRNSKRSKRISDLFNEA